MKLYNEIRTILNLEENSKTFFTKAETKVIAQAVCPPSDLDLNQKSASMLPTNVPGWRKQTTVSTHPTLINLMNIADRLNTVKALKADTSKYTLAQVLPLLGDELRNISKSIKIVENTILIELK